MPKAQIHFFSATGNSRLAAEVVSSGLEKAGWQVSLNDIRTMDTGKNAESLASADIAGADLLGFVFPIYAFRAAIPMEKHLRALPPAPRPRPVFLVATFAGYLDRSFMRVRDFLVAKNYIPILTTTLICEDAWTVARIPGLIYDKGRPTKQSLEDLREFCANEIPRVWLENRDSPKDCVLWIPYNPITFIAATFPIAVGKGVQFPIFVRKSLCTRCGACVRQCPMKRLRLDPFPKARGECVGCYGCINICPTDAINTWFTNGHVRYRGATVRKEDL